MSDEYDLKPLEPKKDPPADPAPQPTPEALVGLTPQTPLPAAATASGDPATPPPTPPGLPPGFVPPVPIIEGPDGERVFSAAELEDIHKHKGIAIVGYIPPLFLIPLLVAPNSRSARFHANQGLLVFILSFAVVIACGFLTACIYLLLPFLDKFGLGVLVWFGSCAAWLGQVVLVLLVLALSVLGIINAANGEFKPLPLIGRYTLIK